MKQEDTTAPQTGSSEVAEVLEQKEGGDAKPPEEDVGNGGSGMYDPEDKQDSEDNGVEQKPQESEEDYRHQPMFVCCCGSSFQFLGQITSHKKKNCEWIFVCPHCDRVYKDFAKMAEHKKIHQKPAPETVLAPVPAPAVPVPALSIKVKDNRIEGAESEDKDDQKENPSKEVKSDDGSKPDDLKDSKDTAATGPKKIELVLAQTKPKLQIKPVEKKIPSHFRARGPNQTSGNFMGNQMRPNMMQNQGMMNPQQNFMGGFNQGMSYGMGMQPMMNMGMGNYGPMNPGMNMGNFGGFNMPNNQFYGPNMGMNMGMNMGGPNMGGMNNMGMNMGGPNMGGMNMGGMNMGGMNVGMNVVGMNNAPNMGGMNNASNMGGMSIAPNMGGLNNAPGVGGLPGGPNIGGMHNSPNMVGMNMGSNVGNALMKQGGFNPTPGGNKPLGSRDLLLSGNRGLSGDMGRDVKVEPIRGRSPSPRRGEDSRSSLGKSPPRRGLDKERDSFRDREFRDRFDYRDEDPIDRLVSTDRKPFHDSRDRYSPSDRDRSERSWPKKSMSREEFLSSSSSSFFAKSSSVIGGFSKNDSLYDRNYSPRDDGPPGLGKLGFGGMQKRDNHDPLIISRPAKIMRSSEYH